LAKNLCAGDRQAGGGDRDDLGQPASDPGRRAPQQSMNLSHLLIFHGRRKKMAHREDGPMSLTSRDVRENSNMRFDRTPIGSGFVALIGQPANEISSPGSDS
jgi:hypothetical protein